MAKTVTDEAIIAALLERGTMKAAADQLHISTRTIYDRMQAEDFRQMYDTAKTDILRTAVNGFNSNLTDAIDTIAGIMKNKNGSAANRLKAAQMIITNASSFAAQLEEAERKAKPRPGLDTLDTLLM